MSQSCTCMSCRYCKKREWIEITSHVKPGSFSSVDMKLLQCSCCSQVFEEEVWQCENQHLSCGDCKRSNDDKCSKCSFTIKLRVQGMERIVASIEYRCTFREFGCPVALPRSQLLEHQHSCIYRA